MTTKEKILQILTEKKRKIECEKNISVEQTSSLIFGGEPDCKNESSAFSDAISGELLAAECGVSRAAVWKAVSSLRNEGFLIEGTPNGGYVLCDGGDIFSENLFLAEFCSAFPKFSGCHIECFSQIDSTNTYAKKLLSECGNLRDSNENLTEDGRKYHKAIFVAEEQTAGRGRLGRTFVSPKKTGVYLSVIYAPKGGINAPAKLTAFSALAVCRALKKLFDIDTEIKWVNDIFYGGKKVGGILTEGIVNFETKKIESAVIGIGVNIFDNPVFSDELKRTAGFVCSERESEVAGGVDCICEEKEKIRLHPSRCKIAAQIAGEIFSILEEDSGVQDESAFEKKSESFERAEKVELKLMEEYRKKNFLIGKEVFVHPVIGDEKSVYLAKVLDIDENAALVVECADGSKKSLNSGEVSIKSESVVKNEF